MKAKNIIIGAFFLISGAVGAQTPGPQTYPVKYHSLGTFKNLKVGDIVPDFEIPKIIHSTNRSAKISDFKDQLLIVDFWSINCSGCVAGLPKMRALQNKFGNKIKILPVTWEEEPTVLAFWKTNKYTKGLTDLPSVIEDVNFSSHFQHEAIPHEVWINKGKVIGITEPEYVDEDNITKVLAGNIPNWPVKDDYYVFNGKKEALFKRDPKKGPLYTVITGYKEKNGASAAGLFGSSGAVKDAVKKTVKVYDINQPVYNCYFSKLNLLTTPGTLVKPSEYGIGSNEVIWEVKDKFKYMYDQQHDKYRGDWLRKNAICYEFVYPDQGQTDKEIAKSVIADLNRLLGLKVRWEKRKEKVLVLVRTSSVDKLKSAGPAKDVNFERQQGSLYLYRNSSVSNIPYMLNQQANNPYVYDETKYTGEVDMDLNIPSWTDIAAVRKAIQAYDLDLKEEERMVDKLIFTEVNDGSSAIDAVHEKGLLK